MYKISRIRKSLTLGVGGFMFAAGLVAPEARVGGDDVRARQGGLIKDLTGCLPLILLGAARLIGTAIQQYLGLFCTRLFHKNFVLFLWK
jgi:hypothetical protein